MIRPKTVRLIDVLRPACAEDGRGRPTVRRGALLARALPALVGAVPGAMGGTGDVGTAHDTPALRRQIIPAALETKILSLDLANLSAHDVNEVLRYGPAPRIVALQGSVPLVTMQPFADFLVAMGYPAPQLVDPEPYRADGSATVRTVTLPASTGHIGSSRARHLAENPVTRAWIDGYRPGGRRALPTGVGTTNLVHAADIWFSVRRHWCVEAQKLIHARRSVRRPSALSGG